MPPRKVDAGWRIDKMVSPAVVLLLLSNVIGLGAVGLQVKWKGELTADQLALLRIDRDADRQEYTKEFTEMKIKTARLEEKLSAQEALLRRIDANTSKSKPDSAGGG